MTDGHGFDEIDAAEPVDPAEAPAAAFPDEKERPCFRIYDDWIDTGRRKYKPGVYWHAMSEPKGDAPPAQINTRVCGPLYIEARTVDPTRGQGRDFGSLLRFKNRSGKWVTWAMPARIAEGDASELRRELADMGLSLEPRQRPRFLDYLHWREPKKEIRCATAVGWCGRGAFVLTDEVIGPGAAGVIFQSEAREHDGHGQAGTLDAWREKVASRAVGNPMLMLDISAGFTGPMLWPTKQESGGLHKTGDSSTGKSTGLEGARSIWGPPDFTRSWRATANGLEGTAAMHNDCLLPLDEISQCDPREVGAVSYMIGNGQGKSRATRTGAARAIKRWRTFLLSTGERTIGATMAEGGHRIKAGQSIRILDVRADGRAHGVFDELHGFTSGRALADAIKEAAAECYGTAGRAFLERLTRDERDFGELLARMKALPAFGAGKSEQEGRAGGRFALVAMAGELATEYGITGWPKGDATKAAIEAFQIWNRDRGKGQTEPRQILQAVTDFLDLHSDNRFSNLRPINSELAPWVRDRAGWYEGTEDLSGRVYYMTSGAIREAAKGFDFKRVLDVLSEAGALPPPGDKGERAKATRTPDGEVKKLYPVTYAKLGGASDGD